jgi:recombination protein RecA
MALFGGYQKDNLVDNINEWKTINPVSEINVLDRRLKMAKKQEVSELPTKDYRSEVEKIVSKKFGNCMFDGSHIKDNPKVLIPTTPTLDLSLKGGLPEGSWNLISGKPKSGKTSLVLMIAANAQAMGRHVYYLNVEHRFDAKNLTTVSHLKTDPEHFTLIESTKEKILTAQDFLNIAKDIVSTHEKCVIILDSISSLCSENEMGKEIGDLGRADGPRMYGQFCRQNAATMRLNKVLFLGILHVIANTSGYGSPIMEDGGNKIQFQADGKLMIKGVENWEEGSGEDKRKVGQIVQYLIAYNPNGPPGDIVKTYLRYGVGYDNCWEIITLGIDLGLIAKAGSWFQYKSSTGEEVKTQGQTKLYEWFNSNTAELDLLYSKVKELSL